MWGTTRALMAVSLLLALTGCLVTPGRFDATLDIRADRSFAFTYKGEVIAAQDRTRSFDSGPASGDDAPGAAPAALPVALKDDPSPLQGPAADDDAQMRAIADALTREKGFRAARYLGRRRFEIDYAIEGRLTHAFLFPFNLDAEILIPFLAVEMRGDDRVRIRAPGFSNGFDRTQGPAGLGGDSAAAAALDGRFTLTTDADIISQNEETGAQPVAGGQRIVWTITPRTADAPAATLRLRP